MRLILQRWPGTSHLWLGAEPHSLDLPEGRLLGLHLPASAASSRLVVTTTGGMAVLDGPAAGWAVLDLPGRAVSLHAEGPPLRLSGGLGEGPALPALRLWDAPWDDGGPIPEGHWRRARILGNGAVLALAGGAARPFVRISAGGWARISLPTFPLLDGASPVLVALRGPLPLADLDGLTLTLRAGAACDVLWEAVQLRPNSLANSAAPSRR